MTAQSLRLSHSHNLSLYLFYLAPPICISCSYLIADIKLMAVALLLSSQLKDAGLLEQSVHLLKKFLVDLGTKHSEHKVSRACAVNAEVLSAGAD